MCSTGIVLAWSLQHKPSMCKDCCKVTAALCSTSLQHCFGVTCRGTIQDFLFHRAKKQGARCREETGRVGRLQHPMTEGDLFPVKLGGRPAKKPSVQDGHPDTPL